MERGESAFLTQVSRTRKDLSMCTQSSVGGLCLTLAHARRQAYIILHVHGSHWAAPSGIAVSEVAMVCCDAKDGAT